MKSHLEEFKQSKNVNFDNFTGSEFDFSKFEQLSSPKFTKIQNSESLKLPKMTFIDRLSSPKLDITQNRSGGKMIKFQQSQALTSHFERFWSIVCGEKKYSMVANLHTKFFMTSNVPYSPEGVL